MKLLKKQGEVVAVTGRLPSAMMCVMIMACQYAAAGLHQPKTALLSLPLVAWPSIFLCCRGPACLNRALSWLRLSPCC